MRIFFKFLVLLVFFYSCSNNKKDEVLDLNEIASGSKRYKEGVREVEKKKKKEISFSDTLDVRFKGILDSLKSSNLNVQKLDIISFPDRFGAKSITKFYWKEKADSINFIDWEFSDSLKTENAFYNWIDCFGENCRSIKIGEKIKIQKRGILVLVNEKHLIVIDSDKKIDYLNWVSVLKTQLFGENWKYIVFQPKKGKAVWMNYKNEVFTEINKQV